MIVRMGWAFIRGGDSFLDGRGAMTWKFLGIIPLFNASGPDITRWATGRLNIESIWLPAVLCGADLAWTEIDDRHFRVRFFKHGELADISYRVEPDGRLRSVSMPRWGNPGNGPFRYVACGGTVGAERTFGGYTIPTQIPVCWYFGIDRSSPRASSSE